MNNINWDLAPEGATMIISSDKELRWANEDGQWVFFSTKGWEFLTGNPLKLSCWKVIATRPTQTKTVADAVEVFGTKWPSSRYNFAWWDSDTEQMLLGYNETSDTVCTRAEFEAYVNASKIGKILESSDEKEGEKWTHVTNGDYKCKIISEHGDFLWVKVDGAGCPATYKKSELKPIKPTIKPSAAWSLVSKQGWPIHQVTETYDVEEVLAND